MKTNLPTNNFASGQLSHSLNGRFDLPLYSSGVEIMRNFYCNTQGNAIFRNGFEYITETKDSNEARLIEFKFNKDQAYVVEFTVGVIKFLSYDTSGNFGYVQSGGSDLEVANPYSTIEEINELQFSQREDVIYFVHPDYEPYKLTRASATSFTFSTYSRTSDPFSSGNWPIGICFYESRAIYTGSKLEPTTIFGSQAGVYDDMTTGTDDDDGFEFTIAEISEQIEWGLSGSNSLILGTAQGCVAVNGGSVDTAITPTSVSAKLVNGEGCASTPPIKKDGFLLYIEYGGRKLRAFSYDILSETFKADSLNLTNYDITVGGISSLVYRKDKYDIVYTIRGDGSLVGATFNVDEQVNGWHHHKTDGEFVSITQLTRPDGNYDLIACIKREINGSTVHYIERLSGYVDYILFDDFYTGDKEEDETAYKRYIAEKLKTYNHLDSSLCYSNLSDVEITFDGVDTITASSASFTVDDIGNQIWYKTETGREYGRFKITGYTSTTSVTVEVLVEPHENTYSSWYLTANTFSGLDHLEGETVALVGDGGYIDDYVVSSGQISQDREFSSVCVGLKYRGDIKSFNLGFNFQGRSTQLTRKAIYRLAMRFSFSAGGLVGTDPYRMEEIQKFSTSGNYDLPPIPMDGDRYVKYRDDNSKEKRFYIVQDKPLPLNVTLIAPFVESSTVI